MKLNIQLFGGRGASYTSDKKPKGISSSNGKVKFGDLTKGDTFTYQNGEALYKMQITGSDKDGYFISGTRTFNNKVDTEKYLGTLKEDKNITNSRLFQIPFSKIKNLKRGNKK